jgi:hemolysin activation/secretion protein
VKLLSEYCSGAVSAAGLSVARVAAVLAIGTSVLTVAGLVAPACAQSQPGFAPGTVSPIQPLVPPRPPSVAPGLPAVPAVPRVAPTPGVVLAVQDVTVEGASAYPPDQLAKLTEGLTGPAVQQSQIENARASIVDLYRRDGYVYTVVNAILSQGHLRFVVIEGHIASVKLDGDIGPAGTQVLRFLDRLTEAPAVRAADLERWLLLASDVPGVTLRSTLAPSADEPGALTLIAKVSRQAVSGSILLDNRAFKQTGPEEGLAILDFNSFTEFGERTELSFYHSLLNSSQIFGQAASEFYLGGSGLKLKVYGGAGDAAPNGSLALIGYDGTTTIFGAQLTYPLVRVRQYTLNLIGAVDAEESQITNTLGINGTRAQQSSDSLRILRAGAEYARLDNLFGPEMSATDGATFKLSQGLTILGAAQNGDSQAPRLNERVDFTKFAATITRNQTLFQPWNGASVALEGTVAGQYTGDVLPLVEKYYLGGPHFNRGYYWGQVTGDNALQASAELQLNMPIPLPAAIPLELNAQWYAFYDWGETWERQNTDPNYILRSYGGGVRLYLTKYTEFDFEGVARQNRYPNGNSLNVKPLGPEAFYWQVLARF